MTVEILAAIVAVILMGVGGVTAVLLMRNRGPRAPRVRSPRVRRVVTPAAPAIPGQGITGKQLIACIAGGVMVIGLVALFLAPLEIALTLILGGAVVLFLCWDGAGDFLEGAWYGATNAVADARTARAAATAATPAGATPAGATGTSIFSMSWLTTENLPKIFFFGSIAGLLLTWLTVGLTLSAILWFSAAILASFITMMDKWGPVGTFGGEMLAKVCNFIVANLTAGGATSLVTIAAIALTSMVVLWGLAALEPNGNYKNWAELAYFLAVGCGCLALIVGLFKSRTRTPPS